MCTHLPVLLPCCSGPMDSTSLTTRDRVALSSFSRPKSWRRSGWSSSTWPCELSVFFFFFFFSPVIVWQLWEECALLFFPATLSQLYTRPVLFFRSGHVTRCSDFLNLCRRTVPNTTGLCWWTEQAVGFLKKKKIWTCSTKATRPLTNHC